MAIKKKRPNFSNGIKLRAFINLAKRHLEKMAAERDKLRELVDNYQDVLESTDAGIRAFEEAVEELSQLL